MKQHWQPAELDEAWTLSEAEIELLSGRTMSRRLAFALQLKHLELEGSFPSAASDFPPSVVTFVAKQLDTDEDFDFDTSDRTTRRQRATIREFLGYRTFSIRDHRDLRAWLLEEAIDSEPRRDRLVERAIGRCRERRVEPPGRWRLERIIGSALRAHQKRVFATVAADLSLDARAAIDRVLETDEETGASTMQVLKSDPGRLSMKTAEAEVDKMRALDELGLSDTVFVGIPRRVLEYHRSRIESEPASQTQRHPEEILYPLVAIYSWLRRQEVVDSLVELVLQTVQKLTKNAEKRVEKEFLREIRKVAGKHTILWQIAEASLNSPDDPVRKVVFPVASEQTLRDLVEEYRANGPEYEKKIRMFVRSSYSGHYRSLFSLILSHLDLRSNNTAHRPVLDALTIIETHRGSRGRYYLLDEVPVEGVIAKKDRELVIETGSDGAARVNRINYEICVLDALKKGLRCKEIWAAGADRFRNPDEDLPQDFDIQRETYYSRLSLPLSADDFCNDLRGRLSATLTDFAQRLPHNKKVRLSEGTKHPVIVTPLDPLPEPPGLSEIKARVAARWPNTGLLDVLKEADLRLGFTRCFRSTAQRQILSRDEAQRRLLLCLFGLGTNAGLKRVSASRHEVSYSELLNVRRRFIHRPALREAIAQIANAVFEARRSVIWGEGTTACAADGKKFGAWDQNLMTEWHIRYGGRGVMIYWHVDKKSTCIYSQLKRCSSSEVASMIEGVLRHCTSLEVDKQFVDTKGQSEVGFAFSHLLGFDLLPRLKTIQAQKLYLADASDRERCAGIGPMLTRPIRWKLIRDQYDELVKFTTALQEGTADPESILRRFTRGNATHPTYKALKELGKVIKTIFVSRYLDSEDLRREIHDALNVVENWNSANSFVFFGKGGEVASNRFRDQETSILALHLLQMSMVYVNTLMVQAVLDEPGRLDALTDRDRQALTPLIYSHVNPYGVFELDMDERIPLPVAA